MPVDYFKLITTHISYTTLYFDTLHFFRIQIIRLVPAFNLKSEMAHLFLKRRGQSLSKQLIVIYVQVYLNTFFGKYAQAIYFEKHAVFFLKNICLCSFCTIHILISFCLITRNISMLETSKIIAIAMFQQQGSIAQATQSVKF